MYTPPHSPPSHPHHRRIFDVGLQPCYTYVTEGSEMKKKSSCEYAFDRFGSTVRELIHLLLHPSSTDAQAVVSLDYTSIVRVGGSIVKH